MNPKKSSIIVGTIYKHPSMDLTDFNSNYLTNLLEKISKEQKSVFLLGHFNINCNVHNPTYKFLLHQTLFCLTSCSQLELPVTQKH